MLMTFLSGESPAAFFNSADLSSCLTTAQEKQLRAAVGSGDRAGAVH